MDPEEARRARAAARASWPGGVISLADEGAGGLEGTTTAGERLAMVWRLTQDSWTSAGRVIPIYERRTMPGRVIRR